MLAKELVNVFQGLGFTHVVRTYEDDDAILLQFKRGSIIELDRVNDLFHW